jgi:hypothetical protein
MGTTIPPPRHRLTHDRILSGPPVETSPRVLQARSFFYPAQRANNLAANL